MCVTGIKGYSIWHKISSAYDKPVSIEFDLYGMCQNIVSKKIIPFDIPTTRPNNES